MHLYCTWAPLSLRNSVRKNFIFHKVFVSPSPKDPTTCSCWADLQCFQTSTVCSCLPFLTLYYWFLEDRNLFFNLLFFLHWASCCHRLTYFKAFLRLLEYQVLGAQKQNFFYGFLIWRTYVQMNNAWQCVNWLIELMLLQTQILKYLLTFVLLSYSITVI